MTVQAAIRKYGQATPTFQPDTHNQKQAIAIFQADIQKQKQV
jgi:hypothetical protein